MEILLTLHSWVKYICFKNILKNAIQTNGGKPQNLPFLLRGCESQLIHSSPVQPHSPLKWQLDWFTHFRTTMPQSPHWLQYGCPTFTPKLPLPLRQSPPLSNTPIPQPTPLTIPNSIQIQSAIFPQSTHWTNRWTDEIGNKPVLTPAYGLLNV